MRIFIAMSKKAPSQNSSREDFEQLSAIEESMASIGIADLESEQGVILKDWSAQDFSHAYVRFRPHLERHAARFLRDPSQVEEVVQDAFLYLMTALPELDSEIGVLRFLKWKTKMLALDIIRINSKYSVAPIEDHEHYLEVANQDELGLDLERADDSAVVSLALAKLSRRQRQVIVETQLLERPLDEVADEMGLSNNAFRQLLHRARAAFKSALVGEAEIRGLPTSAILSIAARKAARESGKLIAGASALLVAILGLASISQSPDLPIASVERGGSFIAEVPEVPAVDDKSDSSREPSFSSVENFAAPQVLPEDEEEPELEFDDGSLSLTSEPGEPAPEPAEGDTAEIALASAVEEFLVLQTFEDSRGYQVEVGDELVVKTGGIKATFGVDLRSDNPVQFVFLTVQLPQGEVIAVPTNGLSVAERSSSGRSVSYAATDFIVGDLEGAHGNAASASTELQGYALLLSFSHSEVNGLEVLSFAFEGKSKA